MKKKTIGITTVSISILLFLVTFSIPIFMLRNKSHYDGGDSALFYRIEGKDIMVLATESFNVHSSGRGINSGTTSNYIQAYQIDKGNILWRIEIDGGYYKEILGQSEHFLYVFADDLLILDKLDGNIVAKREDLEKMNPQMHTLFPDDNFSNNYYMVQDALLFEGNDGIIYEIQEQNRNFVIHKFDTASASTNEKLALYANRGKNSLNKEEQQKSESILTENKWMALIVPGKASTKEKISDFATRDNTPHKKLYEVKYSPLTEQSVTLKQLNDHFFIDGAFLIEKKEIPEIGKGAKQLISITDSILSDISTDYSSQDYSSLKESWYKKEVGETRIRMNNPNYQNIKAKENEWREGLFKRRDSLRDIRHRIERDKESLEKVSKHSEGLKVGEGYLVIHKVNTERDSEILLSCIATNGDILWSESLGISDIQVQKVLDDRIVFAGSFADDKNTGINRICTVDLKNHEIHSQNIFPSISTTIYKPKIDFNSTSWITIIISMLNIIFVIVAIYYILNMLVFKPLKTKNRYNTLSKNGGAQLTGRILESLIEPFSKNKYSKTDITVRFQNLVGESMTHDFSVIDTKPFENRYQKGKQVTLLADTKDNNIFLAGGDMKMNYKIILLALLPISIILFFFYIAYTDAYGNLIGLGTFGSAISVIMWISIVFLVIIKVFFKPKSAAKNMEFELYGVNTFAEITSYEQTNLYINNQPVVKLNLSFTDKYGTTQHVSVKQTVHLINLGKLNNEVLEIIYIKENPSQIKILTEL